MTNDGTQDPGPPPVVSDPLSGLVTGSRYEQEPVHVRVVEPPMPDISAVREAMVGMLDDDSELDLSLVSKVTQQAMGGNLPIPAQGGSPDVAGGGLPGGSGAPAGASDGTAEGGSGGAASAGAGPDGSAAGGAADSAEAASPAAAPAAAPPTAPSTAPNDPTPTPPIGIPTQKVIPEPRSAAGSPVTAKAITPGTIETPRRLPRQWPRLRRRQAPPRPAWAVGRKSSAPSIAAIALLLLVIGVIAIVLVASFIDTIASIFG